jgi:hypothetical protein
LAVEGPAVQRGNSEAFNGSYENHSTDEGLSAGTGEESRSGQPHLWRHNRLYITHLLTTDFNKFQQISKLVKRSILSLL